MPVVTAGATAQYLIFQVANQPCAANLHEVSEIALMAELSPPFGPSEVLAGLLNIGGAAHPILHLNRILKLEDSTSTLYSHILLVKTESGTVGFLIQSAQKITAIARDDIKPLQAEAVRPFFNTMIPDGKSFVGVLELAKIAAYYEQNLGALKTSDNPLPSIVKAAS